MRIDSSFEKELLDGAKRFDSNVLTVIYDQFKNGIYAYSLHLLGKPDLAEECVAETFSRFLRALYKGLCPEDHLQAYLYRIAHNWISDIYRSRTTLATDLDEDLADEERPSLPESLDKRIEQARMRAALRQLTDGQRQVIALNFLEGWEEAEVAAALNKSAGAIRALKHRAIANLRKIMAEDEIEEE
jgi:RNA polymerase sigma-70 factor (ECF subfamily)